MKITKEEVLHVANLARLELDDAEIERFSKQIGTVLEYVETLNQVDTSGVSSTFNAIYLSNAFREDKETPHLDRDEILSNAPDKDDAFFLVPKVIG